MTVVFMMGAVVLIPLLIVSGWFIFICFQDLFRKRKEFDRMYEETVKKMKNR